MRLVNLLKDLWWALVIGVGLLAFLVAGAGLGWGLLHLILESW